MKACADQGNGYFRNVWTEDGRTIQHIHKTFENSADNWRVGRRKTIQMFEVKNFCHFSGEDIKAKLVLSHGKWRE